MKRLPIFAAAAASIIAIVAGFWIVPGPLERVTMLVRDGRPEAALERANALVDSGNRDAGLLMQAYLLNERYGDQQRAEQALSYYFTVKPDDADGWRKVATIRSQRNNVEGLTVALEHIVRIASDPAAASQLARVYRLHGRYQDEERVLSSVNVTMLEIADVVRLASLLIGRGELPKATAILRQLDDTAKIQTNDARTVLFGALIDQREYDEAASRAVKWHADSDARALEDVFVRYLLRAGADGPAMRLALLDDNATNPKKFAYFVSVLADEGQYHLLERFIISWLDEGRKLPAADIDGFFQSVISIARSKGLGERLFTQFMLSFERGGSNDLKASLLQAMFNEFGHQGIAPFRNLLTADVLAERPVMAARVMFLENNVLASTYFIRRANLLTLSPRDRFDWLSVAESVLPRDELLKEISHRAGMKTIPPEMKRAILEIAMREGVRPDLVQIWSEFFREKPAQEPEKVSSIRGST